MRVRSRSVTALIALVAGLPPAFAADGDPDLSFSTDGRTTIDFATGSSHEDRAYGAALQSDGKLVVVGRARFTASDTDFAIARLNLDGSPDTTFSGDGMTTVAFDLDAPANTQILDEARSVAIDGFGRIVVCGTARNASVRRVAIARLTSTGALDPAFSGDGRLDLAADPANLALAADHCQIFVDDNGALVVTTTLALIKIHANGELFGGFGTAGYAKASTACGNDWDYCGFLESVQHPDGYYFTAGYGHNGTSFSDEPVLFCHWAGLGFLNGSFANGGRLVTLPPPLGGGRAEAVHLDSHGRLIVHYSNYAGAGGEGWSTRVDVGAEAIDPTFGLVGSPGWLDLGILNPASTTWFELGLAPDDKIVVFGKEDLATSSVAVARALANGSGGDNGFSLDALAETEFVAGGAASVAALVVADGRPTIVGTTFNQSDDDFAIARFQAAILFQDGFEIGSTWRWSSASP
jgi:uncharacterized delta-60 repeat protein